MGDRENQFSSLTDIVSTVEAVGVLRRIVLFLMALSLIGFIFPLLIKGTGWKNLSINSFMLFCASGIVLLLLYRNYFRMAVYLALVVYGVIFILAAWGGVGVRGSAYLLCALLVLAAGLFLGKKAAYFATLSISLAGLGLVIAEKYGLLVNLDQKIDGFAAWVIAVFFFVVVARLVDFILNFVERAFNQARQELVESALRSRCAD